MIGNRHAAAAWGGWLLLLFAAVPQWAAGDPGLLARYSDGKATVTTAVAVPAFSLKENESVHPQVGVTFSAEYEGTIKLLRRGTYTFAADGATLKIDGKNVAGPVELEAGEHPITIGYERKGAGPARLQVVWSSEQFLSEPLPTGVLSYTPTGGVKGQLLVEHGRLL